MRERVCVYVCVHTCMRACEGKKMIEIAVCPDYLKISKDVTMHGKSLFLEGNYCPDTKWKNIML